MAAIKDSQDFSNDVARKLEIDVKRVRAAIRLLEEGNTIPFIARYRKELTGELDENQLRDIASVYDAAKNLAARKSDVLRLLEEQGVLEDEEKATELRQAIAQAGSVAEVDDIYRPFRPKRKTRASIAREKGLEPLVDWLESAAKVTAYADIEAKARTFVQEEKGVANVEEAIQGALDIIAETISDDANNRKFIRTATFRQGLIRSLATDPSADTVYEQYYDYSEAIAKIPPHRVLAMNRGERDEALKVAIIAPEEAIVQRLWRRYGGVPEDGGAVTIGTLIGRAAVDAYKRLIAPSIERDVRTALTEMAEARAIDVFGSNLKSLLLQPPLRDKRVLGVDPAYRTGCKLAVVDETGKLLEVAVIYPTPPQSRVAEAQAKVLEFIKRHGIGVIAIGNGTASRETEAFIAECIRSHRESAGMDVDLAYVMVSEAGASVYSASPLAGEEFPDLDVAERSAISIARRLQDPLAELVKIDPKSIGVGQYQHDVSQTQLGDKLGAVVESAVNQVGVDVNTASPSLLMYVAGLNKTAAKNIVQFREANGRIANRKALAKVPRIGPKTLEQAVGFLRIHEGDNVLDSTPIHPESYPVVERLLSDSGVESDILRDTASRKTWLEKVRATRLSDIAARIDTGVPTLRDILEALERPGRDPRDDVPAPLLRKDVVKLEDLTVGMELTGTVRNVVDFGAFVDVGVKNDGLVHISELGDTYVKHPMDAVSVGDIVKVRVVQVDVAKGRLGLSMKGMGANPSR